MKSALKSLIYSIPLVLAVNGISYSQSDYPRFCDCSQMETNLQTANSYLTELETLEERGLEEKSSHPLDKLELDIIIKSKNKLIRIMREILDNENNCGCYKIVL